MKYREFNILTTIYKNENSKIMHRELKNRINATEEDSKTIINLMDAQLVAMDSDENLIVTDRGYKALEPYKVERAVIMAAGLGSRLMPITINTPKPMVKVNGKRIIETLIDALIQVGIEDIVIVRGYLKENFEVLLHKYPMIKFVDNPQYASANSISSIYYARDYLKNAYIMEADLYLSNPDILSKYQYKSNGLGIKTSNSDDWFFTVVDNHITKLCKPNEEVDAECEKYQEVGISYVNDEDGKKLARHLEEVFEKDGGSDVFWDQVQYDIHIDEYTFAIRECIREDIVEIDSFKELVQIDDAYTINN